MNKDYVLLKAFIDYVDEFDCEMFTVINKQTWEAYKNKVKKAFKDHPGVEVCFGTNEHLEVENYESWLEPIIEVEITKDEYSNIYNLLGKSFGTAAGYFHILQYSYEDKEEDQ